MKCIAIRACQKRMELGPFKGKVVYFRIGEMGEFPECPDGFRPIGTTVDYEERDPVGDTVTVKEGVDFANASEEELMEAEFMIDELKEYMKEKHPSVPFAGNIGLEKLVAKLLYARDNDTMATGEDKAAIGTADGGQDLSDVEL